jgi:hypothetical protein
LISAAKLDTPKGIKYNRRVCQALLFDGRWPNAEQQATADQHADA